MDADKSAASFADRSSLAGEVERRLSRVEILRGDTQANRHYYGGATVDGEPLLWQGSQGGQLAGLGAAVPTSYVFDWRVSKRKRSACGCTKFLVKAGGSWSVAALRCNDPMCVHCVAARSGRKVRQWLPPLEHVRGTALTTLHVTLTQPARPGPVSASGRVVRGEQSRWIGSGDPDVAMGPVGGEGMQASGARVLGSFRALRERQSSRRLAEKFLGGYVVGREWTLRKGEPPDAPPTPQKPRWHAHLHLLVMTGHADWWPEFRDAWCRVARSSPGAQCCQEVRDAKGLLEVLKYPVAVGDLTAAASAEAWAGLRGGRFHYVAGRLSRASDYSDLEPWRTAIELSERREPCPALEYLDTVTKTWRLYGLDGPAMGLERWRCDGVEWTGNAEEFAILLGRDPDMEYTHPDQIDRDSVDGPLGVL